MAKSLKSEIPLETFSRVVESIYDCALDPNRGQREGEAQPQGFLDSIGINVLRRARIGWWAAHRYEGQPRYGDALRCAS